jgi:hypothetical protein
MSNSIDPRGVGHEDVASSLRQSTAGTLLGAGLAAFLMAFGTELMTAHEWAEVTTPTMVGKTLIQLGGVGMAIFGALRIKLK